MNALINYLVLTTSLIVLGCRLPIAVHVVDGALDVIHISRRGKIRPRVVSIYERTPDSYEIEIAYENVLK